MNKKVNQYIENSISRLIIHCQEIPEYIDKDKRIIINVKETSHSDYEQFKKYLEKPEIAGAFFKYLSQCDISAFNPRDIPRGKSFKQKKLIH